MEEKILLDNLSFDTKFYPREKVNYITVYKYKKHYEAGSAFPVIKVVKRGQGFLILDGVHRYTAAKELGLEHLDAEVLKIPKSRWLEAALRFNATNGLPLSAYEIAKNVIRLQELGYTYEQIAEAVLMPVHTLREFTRRHTVLSPINKSRVPLKKPFRRFKGDFEIGAREVSEEEQKGCLGFDFITLANELLYLLKNNLVDLRNAVVMDVLSALKEQLDMILVDRMDEKTG